VQDLSARSDKIEIASSPSCPRNGIRRVTLILSSRASASFAAPQRVKTWSVAESVDGSYLSPTITVSLDIPIAIGLAEACKDGGDEPAHDCGEGAQSERKAP
jgi:hypothetical protein